MRGTVTFAAGGAQHALRFTTNALCTLEEQTGQAIGEIIADLSVPGKQSRNFRLLFWAGLGTGTIEAAGDLIDEIGLSEADRLLTEALRLAFPSVEGNGKAAAA